MYLTALIAWPLLASIAVSSDADTIVSQQPVQSSYEHDVFDPSFDSFVQDTLSECHVPGLSIAVVDNGKITSKGYGFSVLGPDQKATADTQYFTASTTKAFTAAAAALLVHNEDAYASVKWTTPIAQSIREDFVLEDEYATSHTTIEDALSHRTGQPGHDLTLGQANGTPSRVVQRMRYLPMTAQPRTQWQYCNMMYAVITDLIQTVTGLDLETFQREHFWEPLGMRSTTFQIPSDTRKRSRLARGYYWDPDTDEQAATSNNGRFVPDVYLNMLDTKGDGATISTKSWNSSSPITRRVFRDLVTPRAIISDDDWESSNIFGPLLYALGWIIGHVGNAQFVTHSGGITGFGTQVYLLPDQSYGVVTMGNTAGTSNEAGGIIASKLLLQKLDSATDSSILASSIQESLLKVQEAGRRPRRARLGCQRSCAVLERFPEHSERLPLPLPLPTFAGLYCHPAYGSMNLTMPTSKMMASPPHVSGRVLETIFDRTSVEKEVLTHISGTLFEVKSFEPHGLGDINTGEGIVWEDLGDEGWEAFAMFEFGIDGRTVDRVGIELDPDMIEVARKKGKRYWRDGMIWFQRVVV